MVGARRLDVVKARDKGADFHAGGEAENFFGDGAGGHAADGLARRGAPAAPVVADAVLDLVGVVRVRGAELLLHLVVGAGAGVGVAHKHRERRAGRAPLEEPGENFDLVLLLARRDEIALPGPAAVELGLDLGDRQRQAGRAAVDHHAHRATVAFAPGGDGKKFAEGVGHGLSA